MLGADLEPAAVLTEALRVARESARDAEVRTLLLEGCDNPARAWPQRHRGCRRPADDRAQYQAPPGDDTMCGLLTDAGYKPLAFR